MNQKGFVNILLIVLVVVLAGVAGYFVLNNRSAISTPTPPIDKQPAPPLSPSPSPSPTPSPTPKSTSTPITSGYPSWIKKLIAEKERAPVANPPSSLTQYEYKNQTVYYLPPRCCDIPSVLYNENGIVICSPDGGFTGGGDGRCSDFFTARQNAKVIWTDTRGTIFEKECPNGWGEPASGKCIRGEVAVRISGKYSAEEIIQKIELTGIKLSNENRNIILETQNNLNPQINGGNYRFNLKVTISTEEEIITKIRSIGAGFEAWYSVSLAL